MLMIESEMSAPTNPMIVTSADGSVMVVSVANVGVFTSTDAGATWIRGVVDDGEPFVPIFSNGPQIATNADGSVLGILSNDYVSNNSLFLSKDKGKTWSKKCSYCSLVAIDATGNIFVWDTDDSNGQLNYSTDLGQNFTPIYIRECSPTNIACNADGSRVFITTSTNLWCGTRITNVDETTTYNWVAYEPQQIINGVSAIACDASGKNVVVCESSGNIFINSNDGSGSTDDWLSDSIGHDEYWTSVSMTSNTIIACSNTQNSETGNVYIGTLSRGVWYWSPQMIETTIQQNWTSVAISADGQRAMAITNVGTLFQGTRGSSGGWSWEENTYFTMHFGVWDGLCMSATGDLVAACQSEGNIYTSRNYGGSWTSNPTGEQQWRSIASSAGGQQLIACVHGGNLWQSSDYGATWTELVGNNVNNLPTDIDVQRWTSVASDASGNKLLASTDNGQIYGSSDSGITWCNLFNGEGPSFNNVSMSRDGSLTIAVSTPNVYIGTSNPNPPCEILWEFGSPCQPTQASPNWTSAAIDLSGQHIAVCASPGSIWVTDNHGITWTDTSGAFGGHEHNWMSIDMDDTGQYMVACEQNGLIYTSNNYGVDWTAREFDDVERFWYTVASSADGSVIAAIAFDPQYFIGQIYISRDYGATWTSADYTSPPVDIPTLPPTQIAANIRGKDGAASKLTDFNVGSTLVRNRPQRFTGFDDYGLFTQANALSNTVNLF